MAYLETSQIPAQSPPIPRNLTELEPCWTGWGSERGGGHFPLGARCEELSLAAGLQMVESLGCLGDHCGHRQSGVASLAELCWGTWGHSQSPPESFTDRAPHQELTRAFTCPGQMLDNGNSWSSLLKKSNKFVPPSEPMRT